MFLFSKQVAAVSASLFTWEVTTSFDSLLTEAELQKRFDEEFEGVTEPLDNRVFFWPLVSFNASDGRKHRYLVVRANETLAEYRKKFERCLPKQIALYKIADKMLRGRSDELEDCLVNAASFNDAGDSGIHDFEGCDGNLLLAALWNGILHVLVFVEGRLCHWSEECGYGNSFDEKCNRRMQRFKEFLRNDELFSKSASFESVFVCCDKAECMDDLFDECAYDPFWRCYDLDACKKMKSCKKRKWMLSAMLLGIVILWLSLDSFLPVWKKQSEELLEDVPAAELSLPPGDVLEKLAWAKGHRDMIHHEVFRYEQSRQSPCDSLHVTLLGTAGERAALVKFGDETRTLKLGDSLMKYRVKSIGKSDVVLHCGRKEVRYEVGAR